MNKRRLKKALVKTIRNRPITAGEWSAMHHALRRLPDVVTRVFLAATQRLERALEEMRTGINKLERRPRP